MDNSVGGKGHLWLHITFLHQPYVLQFPLAFGKVIVDTKG